MKVTVLIVLVFLLAGCRKKPPKEFQKCSGNCYVIAGRVTDGVNPLPNIPLSIRYDEHRAYAVNPHFVIGSTTTDQNGYYSFNFSANEYRSAVGTYSIVSQVDGFFAWPHAAHGGDNTLAEFELDSTWIDKPYWKDLRYYRTAWLSVKLSDTSFRASRVDYSFEDREASFWEIKTADATPKKKTAAGVPTIISWYLYRRNDTARRSGSDTILLHVGEERLYEVKWR